MLVLVRNNTLRIFNGSDDQAREILRMPIDDGMSDGQVIELAINAQRFMESIPKKRVRSAKVAKSSAKKAKPDPAKALRQREHVLEVIRANDSCLTTAEIRTLVEQLSGEDNTSTEISNRLQYLKTTGVVSSCKTESGMGWVLNNPEGQPPQ
jgi:hypothetical protein